MNLITAHKINISNTSVPHVVDWSRAVIAHKTASCARLLIDQMKYHDRLTIPGDRKDNNIIDLKFS